MERKLEGTVDYLQPVNSILDAAKQNEELQDWPTQYQTHAYLGLPIDQWFPNFCFSTFMLLLHFS